MATIHEKEHVEIFEHWNSKKIVTHRSLRSDMVKAMNKALKDFTVEDIKELIDFYSTILEAGVPEHEQIYFWSYKWNLFEFLMRGLTKFDGKTLDDYKKQGASEGETYVFK